MKKRIRSVNFSHPEVELLISLVESKKNMIESRKCDAITWQEKEATWQKIEIDFNRLNSNNEVYRDAKCLKLKFESFKKDIRKKERIMQYERYSLGNTTQCFTDLEKRVMDMIVPCVERVDNLIDYDPMEVKNFPFQSTEEKALDEEYNQNNEESFEKHEECEEVEVKPFIGLIDDQTKESDALPIPSSQENDSNKIEHPLRNEIPAQVKLRTRPFFVRNNLRKRRQLTDERVKEAELELIQLQKQLIQQEIKKEIVQTKILQQQYEHQKQIQELEKQQLLLKIQLTKNEVENAKKNSITSANEIQ